MSWNGAVTEWSGCLSSAGGREAPRSSWRWIATTGSSPPRRTPGWTGWPLLSDVELDEVRRQLPPPPPPQGGYVPAAVSGTLVMTAGMTPRVDGVLQQVGRLGAGVSIAQGRAAAAVAAENALSAALSVVPPDQRLDRVVHLRVYVNAVPGFGEHSAVADGASERLRELLDEHGAAARVAVGVASLPKSACVEVELCCSLRGRP